MEQLWADGTSRDGVRARRSQLRAHARAQRHTAGDVPDRFQTPQWLERSFVLPLTDGEVTVVPSQSQPHHDDFPEPPAGKRRGVPAEVEPATAPSFVRPPSQEIDFVRMIKRSDHCRTAIRAAIAAIGFAGVGLVFFLVTMAPLALEMAIACAVLAVFAVGVRIRLATAPVPHVEG
jgi:hypothetical protein